MLLRRALVLLFLGLLLAGAAGCGRKGDPRLPAGVTDSYPRAYPQGSTPPDENIYEKETTR